MGKNTIDHEKLAELLKNGWSFPNVDARRLDQLSLEIADKVTSPETAEVGQTIVVSEVDENGKPTAWEMADMVSGGSGYTLIQSIKTEEIVTAFEIDFAEPLKYREFFIMVNPSMSTTSDGKSTLQVQFNKNTNYNFGTNNQASQMVEKIPHCVYVNLDTGYYHVVQCSDAWYVANYVCGNFRNALTEIEEVTSLYFVPEGAKYHFGVGTNFRIYGR